MMIDDFVADLGQVPNGFRVETLGSYPVAYRFHWLGTDRPHSFGTQRLNGDNVVALKSWIAKTLKLGA